MLARVAKELTVGISQAQGAHAALVVDGQQIVKPREGTERGASLRRLGVRTLDDAPAPGVGLGVGEQQGKRGIIRGRRAPGHSSSGERQIRGDLETLAVACHSGR